VAEFFRLEVDHIPPELLVPPSPDSTYADGVIAGAQSVVDWLNKVKTELLRETLEAPLEAPRPYCSDEAEIEFDLFDGENIKLDEEE